MWTFSSLRAHILIVKGIIITMTKRTSFKLKRSKQTGVVRSNVWGPACENPQAPLLYHHLQNHTYPGGSYRDRLSPFTPLLGIFSLTIPTVATSGYRKYWSTGSLVFVAKELGLKCTVKVSRADGPNCIAFLEFLCVFAVTNSKEENRMLALLPTIVVDHEKVFYLNMLNILTCERELLL